MGEEGEGAGGAEVMAWGPVGAVPVGGGPGKSDAVPSGCGPQWRGSTRWDPSRWGAVPGVGQHFAFFCRLPTLISYVSNLMWVFRGVVLVFWAFSFQKTLKRSGCHTVSREPRCVFFCQ